jgi:hypothetical protein
MFGITIVGKKRFLALEKKLRDYQEIERILEKQESYIEHTAEGIFERHFSKNILETMVEFKTESFKLKEYTSFIKNTIIELINVLIKTEVIKKDKKLVDLFEKVEVKILKEYLRITEQPKKPTEAEMLKKRKELDRLREIHLQKLKNIDKGIV